MTYYSKIGRATSRAKSYRYVLSGAATVTLDQSMKISRNAAKSGSMSSDWKAVGSDVRRAMASAKREFDPV